MFPFDYLKKEFVLVSISQKMLTYNKDYSVNDKKVILKVAPSANDKVRIQRCTTTTPLVKWDDASTLKSNDLNLFKTQIFHLAEELAETTTDGQGNPIVAGDSADTLKALEQLQEQLNQVTEQFNDKLSTVMNTAENIEETVTMKSKQLIEVHNKDENAHDAAFRKHGVLDKSMSVTGGTTVNTSYFQERTYDVFFASAGFVSDFEILGKDTISNTSSYSGGETYYNNIYITKLSSGECINTYVGKILKRSAVHLQFWVQGVSYSNFALIFKISDTQFLKLCTLTSASDVGILELRTLSSLTNLNNDIVSSGVLIQALKDENAIEKNDRGYSSGRFEIFIDIFSKTLIVENLYRGYKWEFDISNVVFTNEVIENFRVYPLGSNLSNFALSSSKIGDLGFRGLVPTSIGSHCDFTGDSFIVYACSPTIIDKNKNKVQNSVLNATQTFKFSMTLPATNFKIKAVYTTVNTLGDGTVAITDLVRANDVEYEGLKYVPSAVEPCITQRIFLKNPTTNTNWTPEDLTKLEVGCKILGEPIDTTTTP